MREKSLNAHQGIETDGVSRLGEASLRQFEFLQCRRDPFSGPGQEEVGCIA
jgi:hypothetical protein